MFMANIAAKQSQTQRMRVFGKAAHRRKANRVGKSLYFI
jgi:hypothetical protein